MTLHRLAAAAALGLCLSTPVHAGAIEQACARSERVGNNTRLCTCIQQIANQLLTGRDQRLAASFFSDPHRAQEVRTSTRPDDARFWTLYRQFTDLAEQRCG